MLSLLVSATARFASASSTSNSFIPLLICVEPCISRALTSLECSLRFQQSFDNARHRRVTNGVHSNLAEFRLSSAALETKKNRLESKGRRGGTNRVKGNQTKSFQTNSRSRLFPQNDEKQEYVRESVGGPVAVAVTVSCSACKDGRERLRCLRIDQTAALASPAIAPSRRREDAHSDLRGYYVGERSLHGEMSIGPR